MAKPSKPLELSDFRREVNDREADSEYGADVWVLTADGLHLPITGVELDHDGDLIIKVSG